MSKQVPDNKAATHQPNSEFHSWKPPFNDGSSCRYDVDTGLEVLQVNTLQSLIQALGYLKYKFANKDVQIVYRGQTSRYKDMGTDDNGRYLFQPSALRHKRRCRILYEAKKEVVNHIATLRKIMSGFAEKFSAVLPESIVLLPNYDSGFKFLLTSEAEYKGDDGIHFPIYC